MQEILGYSYPYSFIYLLVKDEDLFCAIVFLNTFNLLTECVGYMADIFSHIKSIEAYMVSTTKLQQTCI